MCTFILPSSRQSSRKATHTDPIDIHFLSISPPTSLCHNLQSLTLRASGRTDEHHSRKSPKVSFSYGFRPPPPLTISRKDASTAETEKSGVFLCFVWAASTFQWQKFYESPGAHLAHVHQTRRHPQMLCVFVAIFIIIIIIFHGFYSAIGDAMVSMSMTTPAVEGIIYGFIYC